MILVNLFSYYFYKKTAMSKNSLKPQQNDGKFDYRGRPETGNRSPELAKRHGIRFIQDLFDMAGDSTKFAASMDLPATTVEAWRRSGIPTKHWEKIFEIYDVTPAELYGLTKACRRSVVNPIK